MAYATVQELADELRIAVTVANTPRLQSCLDAAALEIDDAIDLPVESAIPSGGWLFSAATAAADPGDGHLRLNKVSLAATTELYLDNLTSSSVNVATALLELVLGDLVRLEDAADDWAQFTMTGSAVAETGWVRLPVDQTSIGPLPLQLVDGERLTVWFFRPSKPAQQALALAKRVNLLRGVEWFKANDSAFGVIGLDEIGALHVPRDGFVRHAATLMPLKRQWGLA